MVFLQLVLNVIGDITLLTAYVSGSKFISTASYRRRGKGVFTKFKDGDVEA